MKIEVNKIITLGNKEKYLVITSVEHNNNNYYYIAECNESEDDIKDNYKIVQAIEKDNKIFIEEVVGESNLKTVLPLFVNKIANNPATGSTTPDKNPNRKDFPFDSPSSFKGIEIIAPSGKFWIAIPIDNTNMECSFKFPFIAPAITTPTANPSGILWRVTANSILNLLLILLFFIPSSWLSKCIWGTKLSSSNKKITPITKPIEGINHCL